MTSSTLSPSAPAPSGLKALAAAMRSWRTASVALLSFSSGMPLGLVWIAIPDWLRSEGVDIRTVGLITVAQAPWSFKVLWSPLMDRYAPPWLGRRRGWIAIAQAALLACTLALAGVGQHPEAPWIVGALALAVAFASATHDIAYDAYTVDVLRKEEQGVAAGARLAVYRAAMYVAGGVSITAAASWGWPLVFAWLAALYLPMLIVAWKSPEPPDVPAAPRTMAEAVWHPFLGFLGRPRALEILAFVLLYKLADGLAMSLLRPFLVDMGYDATDRGVALATVGMLAMIGGTIAGGMMTVTLGLGHSLWLFGFLQIFSNFGYVLVARSDVDRPLMYAATGLDNLASGLGSGAFAVFLIRLTQKRFSATQYALFSSLFGLTRILSGPVSGYTVDAIGWEAFFIATLFAGIPGLILLHRFAPLGVREPEMPLERPSAGAAVSRAGLVARGIAGGAAGFLLGAAGLAALTALKQARGGRAFELRAGLDVIVAPSGPAEWLQMAGVAILALVCGLMTAAVFAARSGGAAGAGAGRPGA
ncbi:MAG TPA: MFS transporter [Candidatus Polarisedimenticolia bacterium]|nr:MFS transporter [Candidatus Polarisedimenticolia bacterium]